MADLTITTSAVVPTIPNPPTGVGAPYLMGVAAVDLTQGQPVYIDATTGLVNLADAVTNPNATAITTAAAKANQSIAVMNSGKCAFGAILTKGAQYVVSHNSGRIAPRADLTTGDSITNLGIAESTTVLRIEIEATGIVL